MENNSRVLAKNTLLLYFRQILIMAVSLYTARVVLAVLGAEDFGIYNVVAGVVTMFGFLGGAMASSSQRYFSYDLGKKDLKHLGITFSVTFQIYLLIALVVLLFVETAGLWFLNTKLVIPSNRLIAANWIFQAAIISFLLTLITTPFMAIIIAHENMTVYAYVSIVEVALKLGIVFLLKYLPYDKLIVYGILLSLVSFINTAIYRFYCHKHYSECKVRFVCDGKLFKEIIAYSGWNLFGNLAAIFKNQGINILLNLHFGTIVNAARGIAGQVNSAVMSFSNNFSTALRPQVIKTYAANQKEDTMRLVFRGCKFTFFLMYIFTLPLCLEMKSILSLWLKNPPEYAVVFTQLVLIDALIDSISYPLMTLAQATGKIRLYQAVVGGILLLNLPVSYVALRFGAPAYSVMLVAIVLSVTAFIVRFFIVSVLGGMSKRQFVIKTIFPCVAVSVGSAILPLLFVLNVNESFFRMFTTVLISGGCSVLSILFLGMTKNERNAVLAKPKSVMLNLFQYPKKSNGKEDCLSSVRYDLRHVEKVENCSGCHACFSSCPKEAISMLANNEGFLLPVIDKKKCVDCGVCEKVCPALNPIKGESVGNLAENTTAYAAINLNEKIRMESSSGGVFTALSEYVISQEGIVFGAKFDRDFLVVHSYTNNIEDLEEFRGSKYVQSKIGTSYKDCKTFLEQGRKVLFSGTPCQIQGLKKYLRKEYSNLLTVDFICHGVPSPFLWQKYIDYRLLKAHARRGEISKTAFRRKINGWKQYSLLFTFANNSEYCASLYKDPYLQIFLKDIALRKSCYECASRGLERPSDITLADFWGIQNVIPRMDDDKGTSLVLLHSSQGRELWSIIEKGLSVKQVSLDCVVKNNRSVVFSPIMPKRRSVFYKDLSNKKFSSVVRKYGVTHIRTRGVRLAKRFVIYALRLAIHKWGGVVHNGYVYYLRPCYTLLIKKSNKRYIFLNKNSACRKVGGVLLFNTRSLRIS